MHKLTSRIALSAAVSAAILLGVATSSPEGATPILSGHGTWSSTLEISFEISVVELPDGSVHGNGRSLAKTPSGIAWFHFDVEDYAYVGDDIIVLGLINKTMNTPPHIVPGTKTAILIRDGGSGGTSQDTAISASGLPPFVTIPLILATPPPMGPPPPELWFPLASGNFTIH